MRTLRITFLLPKLVDHPIGGYKVHYQYANELARRGHAVTIVHPLFDSSAAPRFAKLFQTRRRRTRSDSPPISWFAFEPSIRFVTVPVATPAALPSADTTILTGWQTSEAIIGSDPRLGFLVQIVYDYEFWATQPELRERMAVALSRRDVHRVATSTVVATMLSEMGSDHLATIPAGLQEGEFGRDTSIQERPQLVAFARRHSPIKDTALAIRVATEVIDRLPTATVECFGPASSEALPRGIVDRGVLSNASLRDLYNRCSIFLLTSKVEGWGLPAMEAMACGATVVSTRNGGVEDFIVDGVNGRLVDVGDAATMVDVVVELLEHPSQRTHLGTRGAEDVAHRTSKAAATRLEQLLVELSAIAPS